MRIVGGTLGGRVLRAPAGRSTRPTSEKVREAVFNILGDVAEVSVLDLFAGSGAMGIEALSRGAAHVTFVDNDRNALATLRRNLSELGVEDRASIVAQDAIAAARRAPSEVRLVFADPPYASDLAARAVLALPALPGARIVVEHDRKHAPPDPLGSLLRTDQRRYGDTLVSFYEVPT